MKVVPYYLNHFFLSNESHNPYSGTVLFSTLSLKFREFNTIHDKTYSSFRQVLFFMKFLICSYPSKKSQLPSVLWFFSSCQLFSLYDLWRYKRWKVAATFKLWVGMENFSVHYSKESKTFKTQLFEQAFIINKQNCASMIFLFQILIFSFPNNFCQQWLKKNKTKQNQWTKIVINRE